MNNYIKISVCVLLSFAFSVAPLFCGEKGVPRLTMQQLIAKIAEAEKQMKTVSFSFVQQTKLTVAETEYTVVGTVKIKLPGQLRLECEKPEMYTAVLKGDLLTIYYPRYNQVTTAKLSSMTNDAMFSDLLLKIIGSSKQLSKTYQMSILEQSEQQCVLVMIPRIMPSLKIKVWVNMKTLVYEKLVINSDSFQTTMEINDFEINTIQDDNVFELKLPSDVEKLDLPQE